MEILGYFNGMLIFMLCGSAIYHLFVNLTYLLSLSLSLCLTIYDAI